MQGILSDNLPQGVDVWVFGSRAGRTTKASSDLDLALTAADEIDHKLVGTLLAAFSDSSLPYGVDVVDLGRVEDGFKEIVEAQMIPLPTKRQETDA